MRHCNYGTAEVQPDRRLCKSMRNIDQLGSVYEEATDVQLSRTTTAAKTNTDNFDLGLE